ncbi:NAD(P)-dependent alcohol dehydrogenase [Pricia sp. S334]|uniref:NAD(P)-dependent alcohol dehydrogenase n=1 Tax=Pricia mediterranea TaxID=3076079 RepID=A0ABU3L7L8_9FLAO|nr:NAD(P)-dependent alcohol dehydrogenase [Pricia sp. S334]MDT7829563.1 NAD(P)-dependent alcohol dehydrogenase [Pricia sp. S334]
MKAAIYNKYGPPNVITLAEVEKPRPKDDEILIKIHAATVTSGDVRLRGSDFPPLFWLPARLIFGLFKPKKKILGHELAGSIEAVGKNVSKFKIGDHVFGTTTMLKKGSYAEYICLPQEWKHGVVEKKPENLSFKEAAALPVGAMTAMFLLEKAYLSLGIKKGRKVLIYGASGSVGSYAVQIATRQGATVTGVCSGSNFEMVKSLGAENVIDYKKEDYSILEEKFDIVFDAVGKTTKSKAKKVLNTKGAFVSVKMLTKEKSDSLKRIKNLAEEKKLKPFIDRIFTLDEIVSAHEYVDSGRKRGNVVIDIIQ